MRTVAEPVQSFSPASSGRESPPAPQDASSQARPCALAQLDGQGAQPCSPSTSSHPAAAGVMGPLTTLWSEIIRKKSHKDKLVRYDHPAPEPKQVSMAIVHHSCTWCH